MVASGIVKRVQVDFRVIGEFLFFNFLVEKFYEN